VASFITRNAGNLEMLCHCCNMTQHNHAHAISSDSLTIFFVNTPSIKGPIDCFSVPVIKMQFLC